MLTATLFSFLVACSACAQALDPSFDVSQYAHDAWRVQENGFTRARITSIAQTPDGYLWLGTDLGLYRFNGSRNILWDPPPGQQLPSIMIWSLLAARDGTLWIGTDKGLVSWKGGKLTHYEGLARYYIFTILEDRDGVIWVSGIGIPTGRLCAIKAGSVHCYGEDGSFGTGVVGLYQDKQGILWAGVMNGFWRWQPGPSIFYPVPDALDSIRAFVEGDDGGLLFTTRSGIKRLMNGKIEPCSLPDNLERLRVMRMLRDRDGGLWLGTWNRGLIHIHHGKSDAHSDLTGIDVVALLEDRESDIWAVTSSGLDRFREPAVNRPSPPVQIAQITADGKVYDASNGLRLPAHVRDLAIDYTALTLVAPETIHFRYELEGQDPNWREVVNVRQVQYSNLPPRNYRFRVMACNNSGVWNEAGTFLDFSIAPAYYQTWWFRSLCLLAFLALVYGTYRVRVGQLRAQEQKFREAIESIPAMAFASLPDGYRTFVNKGWVEYTGMTVEQSLGSGWHAAIHPEDLKRVLGEWEAALASEKPMYYEARYRRAEDGQYRWFMVRVVPQRNKRGNIVKWFGTVTDIEDSKRAGEALQRSQFYIGEGQRVAHMGSWAFNAGGFEYWSSELFRIYGLDPSGKPPTIEEYLALVHPEDRAFMKQGIAKMLDDHLAFDFTKRIVRPDGAIRHVRCVGVPVTQGGRFQCFLGTGMDVTEQERLTEKLRMSERYLSEAQSLAHTGSCAIDGTSRETVYWSDEMFRLFGFDPQQGLPMFDQWLQRIHPEDRDMVKLASERTFFTKVNCDVEFRIVKPDGTVKHIHGIGHPVLSATGELVQVLGTMVDVTERKRAEEARDRLRQLETELAHINRVSTLGEMAASLAHEIKQPIAAAITSANSCMEWLAQEPPNLDRARAAAARIDKYGNRAAETIDRIRSFYKKSPPQRELVDVNGIIQEMLTLLKCEADGCSVAMRTELATDLPEIMADRVQLQQVFMNLMVNGIEAMKDSGGELTVKSHLQDGQLQFSVSDTGVGLPAEKMDQIFSAFFTTKPQGSGMGLAISRSIVESHGGRLWATANDGRGATFHFTLPTAAEILQVPATGT
jgi:PAS domain S-box-containing protein